MSDDEEYIPPPPEQNDRQTSFARAFFSAGTDPSVLNMMTEKIDETEEGEEEILPESVVIPPSRPMGRRTSTRTLMRSSVTRMSSRSLMQNHMASGTRPVPPPPAMEGDTPKSSETKEFHRASRQPSWYRELLEQGVSQEDLAAIVGDPDLVPEEDGADAQAKANDEMLAEQHRFLALIEAKKRVRERLGYDPEERRREAKAAPSVTTNPRPCPLPTLKAPRWTPNKEFPYSVPPREVPVIPSGGERFIRQQRVPRQPELQKGEMGSTAGPGQMLVRCLGCKVNLRVNMQATLVLCENCSVVCPASSTRK